MSELQNPDPHTVQQQKDLKVLLEQHAPRVQEIYDWRGLQRGPDCLSPNTRQRYGW